MSRQKLIRHLAAVAEIMVQGGRSETTRTCGNPNCACHSDPARRHGPHLYLTYRSEGKSRSLYVPPERAAAMKKAQAAWARFWELGCELATLNRQQLEREWKRDKRQADAGPRRNRGRVGD